MTARCLCCTAELQRRSSCSGLETRNLTDYSILHSIVYYYCYVVVSALFIYTHFLVLHTHMMTDTTNERTCNKPTDPPLAFLRKTVVLFWENEQLDDIRGQWKFKGRDRQVVDYWFFTHRCRRRRHRVVAVVVLCNGDFQKEFLELHSAIESKQ